MKKIHFVLYASIISLCACSSPVNPSPQPEPEPAKDFTVDFISETLKINNLEAKENVNYEATISFKEENYNYCLPANITILIGKKRISEDKYTYNKDLGYLFIDKELITNNLKIYAERVIIDGYRINFEIDPHIHFYFYPTRNYEVTPIEDTIAIARDLTGKPITDGTGEVNFKYTVDDNHDIDLFWMRGMSDEMKEVETGIYRIANIKENIRVCANTKKIYCKNLCASADYDNQSFTFSWEVKNPSDVNNVQITIKHNGVTETDTASGTSYTYNNVQNESLYQFIFTPELDDGTSGDSIEKDMMLSPNSRVAAFPRVEISTENNLLPPYDVMQDPSGHLNVSTVNNDYIQNIIKIYDDQNINVYDSSTEQQVGEEYNGSKIKVRGNTSTIESNGKESYKIKLKTKADLLDPFLNRSTQTGGDAYKDKEWLLLNCGNQLNELGGFSIENTLKEALNDESITKKDWWVPQCQYVTLFMNNDFKGIYILCEAVSKGNDSETESTIHSRCPISENGFIIENDAYGWTENLTFKTRINELMPSLEYTFKYPDVDDLIEEGGYESEKYQYISNYVKEFENYFYASPIDSRYKNHIDVESFALWTVAHDLMHVDDYLGSNMYIYKKDRSSKLTAGTTWDFDSAFIGNLDDTSAKGLCFHRSSFLYYIRIFKNIDEFAQDTQDIFEACKDKIITDFDNYISYISDKENIYNELLEKEALRFGKPQVQFQPQKGQIEHYLSVQIQYINDHPYVND